MNNINLDNHLRTTKDERALRVLHQLAEMSNFDKRLEVVNENIRHLTANIDRVQKKLNELSTKMRRLLGSGRNSLKPSDYRRGYRDLHLLRIEFDSLLQVS